MFYSSNLLINCDALSFSPAAWSIIKHFLNPDQSKKIVVTGKKDITKYINEDQLWDHMKPKQKVNYVEVFSFFGDRKLENKLNKQQDCGSCGISS